MERVTKPITKRFRNLGLCNSFVLVTAVGLLAAFLLTWLTIFVCVSLRESIAPTGVSITYDETGNKTIVPAPVPDSKQQQAANVVESVQYVLTIVYFTLAMILSSMVFYRCKLKKPIQVLQTSAQRIMDQDLDFTISPEGMDELGQLCAAFDKMRDQLKRNNRELWRLIEERKRLNAAFSHDLRNPVTVLKGAVRVMEKGVTQNLLEKEDILENLKQLENYTRRIESYVEAMSSAQKLEETRCTPTEVSYKELKEEFQEHTRLLLMETDSQAAFHFVGSENAVLLLDQGIFYNIAENLIVNASRYAKEQIEITLSVQQDYLSLSVQDDGTGFSGKILQKGTEPFIREGGNDSQHFGMGLYICRLLSEKHDGDLRIANTEKGGLVTVRLKIGA